MNTIRDEWNEFTEVIPPETSADHRRDLCLAFYAGVLAVLRSQSRNNALSDAAVDALANAWIDECVFCMNAYAHGAPVPP